MEWSLVDLKNLVAEYNKTYFNDEIEKPIVIKWDYSSFKNVECTYATMQYKNKTHILRVNPILHDCSPELMKNTLVHELIHAWQDEWEEPGSMAATLITRKHVVLADHWYNKYGFYTFCDTNGLVKKNYLQFVLRL